ncbi:Lrp/AsnC family transcriptional regulator [Pseudomonas sp. RAC1]|uniref:Lrp/AsnC family transcriptional regulator n=1 Tax=Pseudomonas sp. RAC1 TaxID=3064900 RepID=UPI0027207CCC|nr:Lrp/AsnC family transcriptional regulator [Pseudomonas sp. RAC1]MDV9033029.1 Lrp/AsnC family transcriptional regulator [Pseudomonas sp. RAC1]
MDSFDRQILMHLQRDVSTPLKDLADSVNLSTTPCWKRIKKLEEQGLIRSKVALLDQTKVGLGLTVFVHIKTRHHDKEWLENFADTVKNYDQVMEFYRMAGDWDYLLRVVVKDIGAYDDFYKKLITECKGLSDISSDFAMEQIKLTTVLPL